MDISKRQKEILDFIEKCIAENGYPPSVREIGEAVGLASSSTVHGHLERLSQKGYLRRDPTKPRAIELLKKHTQIAKKTSTNWESSSAIYYAPIIGKVTAGKPITAVEHIEGYFPLPDTYHSPEQIFLLKVQGDSMIEAGIMDGDLLFIRQQSTAQNGDIVVAITDDEEATVKRFFREMNRIRLQPENSSLQPLYFNHVNILGKVIGLYRSFS
ncbi:transcriptional repressor LexA [Alicyclobacillus tolerans]|uniref:transcriptional repressor LexA n=1 Tax=Alicyclobacillus tolerans TaxID=90970 RepID=UPI003B797230